MAIFLLINLNPINQRSIKTLDQPRSTSINLNWAIELTVFEGDSNRMKTRYDPSWWDIAFCKGYSITWKSPFLLFMQLIYSLPTGNPFDHKRFTEVNRNQWPPATRSFKCTSLLISPYTGIYFEVGRVSGSIRITDLPPTWWHHPCRSIILACP